MNNENRKKWLRAYAEYLKSDDWAWVRDQVIKRDRKCRRCSRKYRSSGNCWEVHHTTYQFCGHADINEVESCVLLCLGCHRFVHGLPPVQPTEELLEEIMGWVE